MLKSDKCLLSDLGAEWMLRVSFAIVYVWFGALKPLGVSPAHELVTSTLSWTTTDQVVNILGFCEIIVGLMFLIPRVTKVTLLMFVLHMVGTVMPLLFLRHISFVHWPYALTLVGQYIVKNAVFLAAGAALWVLYRGRKTSTLVK